MEAHGDGDDAAGAEGHGDADNAAPDDGGEVAPPHEALDPGLLEVAVEEDGDGEPEQEVRAHFGDHEPGLKGDVA